jgi:hypothetical protein
VLWLFVIRIRGDQRVNDHGREKFEAFRLKLLLLSGATVLLPFGCLSSLLGRGLGRELMVEAGWEVQLLLAGIALAGLFLFVYVVRFMRLPPVQPPPLEGPSAPPDPRRKPDSDSP